MLEESEEFDLGGILMDYDKLIEQLRSYTYWLGQDGPESHDIHPLIFDEAATALSTLQAENERLRAELERMKRIMRDNGIMTIPSKYPGGPTEWNIPKPRGRKED